MMFIVNRLLETPQLVGKNNAHSHCPTAVGQLLFYKQSDQLVFKKIKEKDSEEYAIKAIKKTAMARKHGARIF